MLARQLVVPLGLVVLVACTPRTTANLQGPSSSAPELRSPEKSGIPKLDASVATRWADLSVESEFGCAVERTGSVYCWGRGPAAEMELREIPKQQPPSSMPYGVRKWGPASRVELVHDARRISTASGLACAIVEDGRVRCWGAVRWGSQHVYDVPGVTGAVELEVADGESCALLETGALWCWSADEFGVPRPRLDGAVAMAVSDNLACGLTKAGDVVCWGQSIEDWHRYDTQFNQKQAAAPPSPLGVPQVEEQDFPDTVEVGRFRGAVDLAISGWNNLCVLRSDGKAVCSERDLFALLRSEELGMREVEGAQGVTQLATTRSHACARTIDERALCWGRNVYGQLGDGGSKTREQAAPVAELAGVVDLSVAEDFSCALTSDDRVACWGFDRGEALAREDIHVHTLDDLQASSLAAAGRTTCAVDQDDALRCWGSDMLEQYGINGVAKPTVVDLPPGGEILGLTPGWEACFLLSSGDLHCGSWTSSLGAGAQLGFSPGQTTAEVRALAGGNPPACVIKGSERKAELECGVSINQVEPERQIKRPIDVSAYNMRGCVAHGSGKVSCFGELYYWGDKPRPPREFETIPGISDAVALSSATYHDCALKRSGTVTCWVGRIESEWNEDGHTPKAVHYRLGDSADMGLSDVVQIVSGASHHCALSKSGEVRCWDDNPYGEQTVWRTAPELDADVVELAAGIEHTCARSKAGKVTCWGEDVWGQLGRVPSRVYLSPTTMKIE